MGLNIKNEETERLIKELAELTGENKTQAITEAIRERLARLRREENAKALSAELLAIGRRSAARLKSEPIPHGDLLYDEKGLPK